MQFNVNKKVKKTSFNHNNFYVVHHTKYRNFSDTIIFNSSYTFTTLF